MTDLAGERLMPEEIGVRVRFMGDSRAEIESPDLTLTLPEKPAAANF